MKFSVKTLLLVLFGVAVVAAIVYAFLPQPVPVELAVIDHGALRVTVDEDGKTRIKEKYIVSAPLSGRLPRIELEPGDRVISSETLIATIEPKAPEILDARVRAEAEAKVKAAEAALKRSAPVVERARAAFEFAESELNRLTGLYQKKSTSKSEFEKAEMDFRTRHHELKSATFDEEIARFELEMAKAVLLRSTPNSNDHDQNLKIHSPISGRVLQVFQESSTVISGGTELLELGDPGDLEVEVDVLSSDAVKIKPGARVLLEHWGGDHPLEAVVSLIEPQGFTKISALGVEEQRVNVIIDFLGPLKNRKSLGDGYRVEARIVVWEHDDVVKVRTSALFRDGEGWAAFVVKDDRAHKQPLKIGHRNGLHAEVLEGLQKNDRVILHPSDKVKTGTQIVPRQVESR